MARQNEITPEQLLEVIEARKINTDPKIDRRLHALQLCGKGKMTNIEIAEKLNVTPFAVCRWIRRATEHGVQSFLVVKSKNQTPLGITSEQRLEIINALKSNRNPDIDNRLIAILLRCEGMRDVEIAKKFGVSETSVRLWISKYRKYGVKPLLTVNGFETRPLEIIPQQRLEIIEIRKNNTDPKIERYLHAILLRSEGMSNAEIAQKFNVSLPCVYKWVNKFKKHGVHPYLTSDYRKPRPLKITEKQHLEIIEMRKNNTDPVIDKRLHAMLLRIQGMKHTEIEEKLGLKPQSVAHLQRRLMKGGVRSLLYEYKKPKERKKYSRNMRFDAEAEWLQQFKAGLESGQIKIRDIKAAYDKKIGKESKSRGHIYCILKRHGLYKTTRRKRKD
jgi:transposase